MAIQPNQLQVEYTAADKAKLDSVAPDAAPAPAIASDSEAIAGVDNAKMITASSLSAAIDAAISSLGENSTSGTFYNQTGSTIPALKIVGQDVSGNLVGVDISDDASVGAMLGLTMAPILNTAAGTVVFTGIILNVTTSFSVGDVLYLDTDGTLTTSIPEIGTGSFAAGHNVVGVGKITKNASNPANKDFKLELEVVGTL